jgi:hypothetical protein
VFDDGIEQIIDVFTSEASPLSLVLLIDDLFIHIYRDLAHRPCRGLCMESTLSSTRGIHA